jgi:hypothetical protein
MIVYVAGERRQWTTSCDMLWIAEGRGHTRRRQLINPGLLLRVRASTLADAGCNKPGAAPHDGLASRPLTEDTEERLRHTVLVKTYLMRIRSKIMPRSAPALLTPRCILAMSEPARREASASCLLPVLFAHTLRTRL